MQECFYNIKKYRDRECPSGPLGALKILNLLKFLRDCFQNFVQYFIQIQEYFKNVVLKKQWPLGSLKASKFLKIQKFFTDWF